MSEQAAAPAAPAAPASNGAGEPSRVVHAGDSYEDFQRQVAERMASQQRLDQPPAPPKTVNPTPKPPPDQLPSEQPAVDPKPVDPEQQVDQPPGDQQQAQQWSQEDIDLLAKAKKWLESDVMPEEFAKKLWPMKAGEETEYETWEEVQQGRMRQRELTRTQQKWDQERKQLEGHVNAYRGHFEAIYNDGNDGADGGDAMFEIFTRQGKWKQLWHLGQKLAGIEQEMIDGANGLGYAVMQRLGLSGKDAHKDYRVQEAIQKEYKRRRGELERESQHRATEFKAQRLEQQQGQTREQQQQEEFFASQRRALDQLRPRAFEAMGLNHDDPVDRDDFQAYFGAIFRQEQAQRVTPEIVMKAARCVKDRREEEAKRKSPPPPSGAKPFQGQLGAGGGKVAASGGPVRMDADQIADKWGLAKW